MLEENRKTVQDLVAEVNVWTRIGKHANVIGLVGVTVFEGTRGAIVEAKLARTILSGTAGRLLWVVMEYAKHGCLSEYLRAKRFGRLDQSSDVVNDRSSNDDDDDDDDASRYVPPDEQTILSSRDMFRYALDVARGMEHLAERQVHIRYSNSNGGKRGKIIFSNRLVPASRFGGAQRARLRGRCAQNLRFRHGKGHSLFRLLSKENPGTNTYTVA